MILSPNIRRIGSGERPNMLNSMTLALYKPMYWPVGVDGKGRTGKPINLVQANLVGYWAYLLVLLCPVLISGCAPHISLSFAAQEDINPGPRGEPLSVLLRIYQLDSKQQFSHIAYADLVEDGSSALAGQLVDSHELIIRPDERKEIRIPMDDEADYVGIVAFFRNPVGEHWQQIEHLPRRMFGTRRSKHIDMVLTEGYLHF